MAEMLEEVLEYKRRFMVIACAYLEFAIFNSDVEDVEF
jgi:hypothetical protein